MKNILFLFLMVLFMSCEPAQYLPDMPVTEPPPIEEVIPETEYIDTYTNVFKISGYPRETTTQLNWRYPFLTYDGVTYDITQEIPFPFNVTYTETERFIDILIDLDTYSSFYFINENMLNIKGIDPDNMTETEFIQIFSFLYSPEYNHTFYRLSGYQRGTTDLLAINTLSIQIGEEFFTDNDLITVYSGDDRIHMLEMNVDNSDYFLFINDNMNAFFNIDLTRMNRGELEIVADVLNRYPEETVWDLAEEYNP